MSGSPMAMSFFKLINDLEKLEFPTNFMKKYGQLLSLSDNVSLYISSGAGWQVKLVRENSQAWFQHGWSEFVEFYSISHGQFLVFTYQGNSCFNVVIYDTITASEIEYPVDVDACQKRKFQVINNPNPATSSKKEVAAPDKVLGMRCYLTPNEKRRVEEYQCRHPSFVVKLTSSRVDFTGNVKIPLRFARKYLKELGMLELGSGTGKIKTWLVKCVSSSCGRHVRFTKGWKVFALENKLKEGDICIFELIKTTTFRVVILPC